MTEAFLLHLTEYGPWGLFALVLIATFGLPIPASLLVMTGGGFAAAGDVPFGIIWLAGFTGVALGDQIVFRIARHAGERHLWRLERLTHTGPLIARAKALLARRGATAVFLARTILSPLGPTMSATAGALGFPWYRYSVAAVPGAAIWALVYAGIGYTAAESLAALAGRIGQVGAVGVLSAGALVIAFWLYQARRSRPS